MTFLKYIYSLILKIICALFGIDNAKKFDTRLRFGRELNLKNPQSLADKISYLELYKVSPLVSKCTDKWAVREYLMEKGLESILVPVVGGPWLDFKKMDWNSLPTSFVLKATHGCKMNYIVVNKPSVNISECEKAVNHWLKTTYGTYSMEPHYYDIPHRFYAEQYLGDIDKLLDYKIHCINGKPEFILVVSDREINGEAAMKLKLDIYDTEWNPIDEVIGFKNERPGNHLVKRPRHLIDMLKIAEKLSEDFRFVRVDLYDTENGVLFGELTFSAAACVFPYLSEDFLVEMGKKLSL
jgi:hypothetical protein